MLDSLIAKFGVASPSTDLPTFGFPAYPPWVQERAAFARSATEGARKNLRGLDGLLSRSCGGPGLGIGPANDPAAAAAVLHRVEDHFPDWMCPFSRPTHLPQELPGERSIIWRGGVISHSSVQAAYWARVA